MSQVTLLTVTHDPEGKNIDLFKQIQHDFNGIYGELFITISNESSYELIKVLEESQINVKIIPKKGAAQARREVVKFGLKGHSQYFHYCDFDRLLTWCKNDLIELKNIVSDIPNHDYLILGRTERAMNTHPLEWVETEKITLQGARDNQLYNSKRNSSKGFRFFNWKSFSIQPLLAFL